MAVKSNWASWICGDNGFIRARGTSRRWRSGAKTVKRRRHYRGRRSAIARRGCRVRCADYRDGGSGGRHRAGRADRDGNGNGNGGGSRTPARG
ncbi:MAG TPA: hypothetical protein VER17_19260 [Tepidisphaeraceae bacterium]|nr:hypothetical protein [Tepidisphaeraceae bacterium]